MTKTKWIDTHVHLFPAGSDSPAMPRHGNRKNTPENYLGILSKNAPEGIVVVHFSKASNSRHVIDALDYLKGKHPATGVVKADDRDVFQWILREDVKGVRIYAKESMPDFSNIQAWYRLWNLVRSRGKHIVIFGATPYLRKAIQQLPQDIPLVIDHLGMPDAEKGINDADWNALLAEMKSRNNTAAPVYFKGPGYRSSIDPKKVQPFVNKIIQTLGIERLMLGASDAPFAGLNADLDWIQRFTLGLARQAACDLNLSEEETVDMLLHNNAMKFYKF